MTYTAIRNRTDSLPWGSVEAHSIFFNWASLSVSRRKSPALQSFWGLMRKCLIVHSVICFRDWMDSWSFVEDLSFVWSGLGSNMLKNMTVWSGLKGCGILEFFFFFFNGCLFLGHCGIRTCYCGWTQLECLINPAINKNGEVTIGVTRLQLKAIHLASLHTNRLVETPPVGRNIQIQERELQRKRDWEHKTRISGLGGWLIIAFTKSTEFF